MLQHQRSWHPICKTINVCLLYPLFSVSILTINKELSLRRRLKLQVNIKALFWLGNELSYHCLDYQLEILYVPILKINKQNLWMRDPTVTEEGNGDESDKHI